MYNALALEQMGYPMKTHLFFLIAILLLICTACQKRYAIIDKKCGTCHATAVVYQKKRPAHEWDRIVFGMKARGLKITAQEERDLTNILHTDLAAP